MSISIQHLRGSESDWSDHDIVVPDGEIVLVKIGDSYKIKIGDGESQAGALPFFGWTQKKLTSLPTHFEMQNGYHYLIESIGNRMTFTVAQPVGETGEFRTAFSFNVPERGTEFNFEDLAYFTGDDTTNGNFYPQPLYHYNVFIFYDGAYQGIVRKTPYDPEE